MIRIGIIVSERCQASSVFAVTDLIMAANYCLSRYFAEPTPLFSYQLIGLTESVRAYNGSDIGPAVKITTCDRPDVVILPGAFESVLEQSHCQSLLDKMPHIFTALHRWHHQGSVIASVCTGNFLLAAAKISAGRPLTCHWASSEVAARLFPNETFNTDNLLIDHGDIVSAGGAMATSQMVLHLIARFHSRELALATGKLMMIELNLESQNRFAMFQPRQNHSDTLVAKLQRTIETSFQSRLDLTSFADLAGIGERQLSRRFKRATGESPLSYLQRYRVEQVKIGLESTSDAINKLILDAGYEDHTSFRRLFKRFTGVTMKEYRSRFGVGA